ncbi:hypothetical protein N0V85_006176 [Neurospora sp. IMI 360204]|nr:hypothetical protein N0V85_006176 [Neurospora sp. IMI 360204]
MSDDGWDDGGPYDDYGYDDNEAGDGGDGNDGYMEITGYAEEIDVETTGYAEVEEVSDDNCTNAEANHDNDHDDRTSSNSGHDADRDEDQDEDGDDDGPTMSNYKYVKPWGGMHGFMRSYGIARTPEGYQEAGELGDAMMEAAHKNGNLK